MRSSLPVPLHPSAERTLMFAGFAGLAGSVFAWDHHRLEPELVQGVATRP
jgi:hypothetical protein